MKKKIALVLSMAMVVTMFGKGVEVYADNASDNGTQITTTTEEVEKPRVFYNVIEHSSVSYSFENGILTVSGSGCVDDSYTKLCKKSDITEVVINSGVNAIGDEAFYECKKLKKVTISDTVTDIGYNAFASTGISEIVIPSTVKRIGAYSFYDCKKLKKVTMPGKFEAVPMYDEDNYTENIMRQVKEIHLNSEFSSNNMCSFNAKKIYTWKNDNKYKSYKGVVYTKNGKKLVMVPAGTENLKIRKGCKTISLKSFMYSYDIEGENYFYCDQLEKITIPSTVKKVVDDVEEEIWDYSELKECKWNIKSKKLTGKSIENLLKIVNKSTEKTLLTYSKSKVKKVNGMYITKDGVLVRYEGRSANLVIPSYVKRIGDNAFCENTYIKKVKLPKKLREIGDYAFSGCKNLSEITWGKKLTTVGKGAFEWANLKNVKLPDSVKSWGEGCFSHSNVQKVTFSKTMKEIPADMFRCTKIKKLEIPGNIKKIGNYAFAQNYKMQSVIIKKGVETIESGAFDECDKIDSVVVAKSVKSIEASAFCDTTINTLKIKGASVMFSDSAFYKVRKIICTEAPDKYIGYMDFRMSDANTGEISMYVAKVEGASGFEISFAKENDFSNEIIKITKNKSGSVTFVLPDNEYDNYRIRPYTNVDGKKIYGQWREYNW